MTNDSRSIDPQAWEKHIVRAGTHCLCPTGEPSPKDHRDHVEPWLTALFQAEHLNLLIGSGLTTAVAHEASAPTVDMAPELFRCDYADAVEDAAKKNAQRLGRASPNVEDQIRAVRDLIGGLDVLAGVAGSSSEDQQLPETAVRLSSEWSASLSEMLLSFIKKILKTERGIETAFSRGEICETGRIRRVLGGFLLAFASRAATRERLHIFTTNYDRLIEYGCDLLGLRVFDRFIGNLSPVFRSSRLGIDLHYNPPGIRGEPRYLEGVVRLTKLHGSLDWRWKHGPSGAIEVQRYGLPFGAPDDHSEVFQAPNNSLLVYPNPAKDVETLEYPYAELFRDFAAALCQPNAVVVTYGYGFGDDHVNRVLRDMLTIPSTHLVIISYNGAGGRLRTFYDRAGREAQITLLVGPHFGDLATLVDNYLPKPAIDRTTWRMVDLLKRRLVPKGDNGLDPSGDGTPEGEESR